MCRSVPTVASRLIPLLFLKSLSVVKWHMVALVGLSHGAPRRVRETRHADRGQWCDSVESFITKGGGGGERERVGKREPEVRAAS